MKRAMSISEVERDDSKRWHAITVNEVGRSDLGISERMLYRKYKEYGL